MYTKYMGTNTEVYNPLFKDSNETFELLYEKQLYIISSHDYLPGIANGKPCSCSDNLLSTLQKGCTQQYRETVIRYGNMRLYV